MAEDTTKCVQPAGGPVGVPDEEGIIESSTQDTKEVPKMTAQVGKPAPDFEANAFVDGGFKNVKLSDYKGKWVVVCFYPGDFTFV